MFDVNFRNILNQLGYTEENLFDEEFEVVTDNLKKYLLNATNNIELPISIEELNAMLLECTGWMIDADSWILILRSTNGLGLISTDPEISNAYDDYHDFICDVKERNLFIELIFKYAMSLGHCFEECCSDVIKGFINSVISQYNYSISHILNSNNKVK